MGNQHPNGSSGGIPPHAGGTEGSGSQHHGSHAAGGIGHGDMMGGKRPRGGGGEEGGGASANTSVFPSKQFQGVIGEAGQGDGGIGIADAAMLDMGGADSSAAGTLDLATLSLVDDDTVPTVFRWEHGGRQVYITGTFNGWSRQIPMHRSGNDFTYIHNLKRGKHAFKFIVDDEWRFAPDQPTVADIEGRINNFIDVTDFKAYTGDRDFEKERSAAEYGHVTASSTSATAFDDRDGAPDGSTNTDASKPPSAPDSMDKHRASAPVPDADGEEFGHTMPDLDEYTKEPPPLPPHLRHIILNKPPQLYDTAALPVPQHVALNHLYCTAIKDNMMVLGITQRYKTKFVTTVYYSPCTN